MGYDWKTCPADIKEFILKLQKDIRVSINDNVLGFYLHGSLAMGGFNLKSSDIDFLVITVKPMNVEDKRQLACLFLNYSDRPYPIEISFLNVEQLNDWKHPCPFDFHYSESWRERYENDLLRGTNKFINEEINTDSDLAAHIRITNERGICLEGKPIKYAFPSVPNADYISSIMGDYQECLINIIKDPIYCSLNMIRVYWYLKEGVIASKQEAGDWGFKVFPQELKTTVKKIGDSYAKNRDVSPFNENELIFLRDYVSGNIHNLLHSTFH